MDAETQQRFIQLATDQPNIICSEVPPELLEAASFAGDEPDQFLRSFFAAGYTQWVVSNHGARTIVAKERVDQAVLVLWVRACSLYTSRMTGRPDDDWTKPFFCDAGLYE